MREVKRRIVIIVVFLLLGAIVNVAVAWGVAYWMDPAARVEPTTLLFHNLDTTMHWWSEEESRPHAGWYVDRQERTGAMRVTSLWHDRDPSVRWIFTGKPEADVPSWGQFLLLPQARTSTGWQYDRRVEAWGIPMLSMYSTWRDDRRFDTVATLSVERGIELPPATRSGLFGTHLAPRALPVIIIWPGFIINTLFYALLLWLLVAAPFAARRLLRRRRGLCEKYAYPIGVSPVCTECGAAVVRRIEM